MRRRWTHEYPVTLKGHDYRVTTWRPGPQFNPRMREFICHGCGKVFYEVCSEERLKQLARRSVNEAARRSAVKRRE